MAAFNRTKPYNELPALPPPAELENLELLKLCLEANRLLAELKGYCQTLPEPQLLLNTLVLQESKASNAIENIVTTQDELYRASLNTEAEAADAATKEVLLYRQAIYWGLEQMSKKELITTNLLIGIMQQLKNTDAGIRKIPGTRLANPQSRQIIYTPPEGELLIREKLAALEMFINDDGLSDLDPLIKMALIHYQFEAIHPFADGNGRAGRILNILYLINKNLIGFPVLYLSDYIIRHKNTYYRLLRNVTEKQEWTAWVRFILNGVAETSADTLLRIKNILDLKKELLPFVKNTLKNMDAREMTDLLFSYPYIKIKTLEQYNIAKRQTASVYLQKLVDAGILKMIRMGKDNYYINHRLMDILTD